MSPLTRAERGWIACILLAAGMRLFLAFRTELYFDETYYWTWSRHLAGGYFDHAPLIAWLIALLGVRPVALVCGLGAAAAVFGLARTVHRTRAAALQAAAVWAAVPLSTLAGVFATPDAPLLLFWTLALWALWQERWVALGAAGGLALLSKYTAVLLAPVHLIGSIWNRRFPRQSLLSAVLAGLMFLPVILWNARHGWAGFRFQLHHGLGGGGGLATLAEFLGGQLLLAGPVLFPFAIAWGVGGKKEERVGRLSTLLPLAVFCISSYRARGEANWAAVAYPAAAVALGAARSRWAAAAVTTGLLIQVLGTAQLLHPVAAGALLTPVARTHGWSELVRLRSTGYTGVITPSYQLASEVAYYARLPVIVRGATRPSQFDYWEEPLPSDGRLAFVSEGEEPPASVTSAYVVGVPDRWPVHFLGHPLHTFWVWPLIPRR